MLPKLQYAICSIVYWRSKRCFSSLSVPFSAINNLGTPLSELQINFGVLQIDTENSAIEDNIEEKLKGQVRKRRKNNQLKSRKQKINVVM